MGSNPADRCKDLVGNTICNFSRKSSKKLAFPGLGEISVFTPPKLLSTKKKKVKILPESPKKCNYFNISYFYYIQLLFILNSIYYFNYNDFNYF